MEVEQVFFNVPLSKLEPIFKRWIREAQAESNEKEHSQQPEELFSEFIPKSEVRGKFASSSTLWNWEKMGKLNSYGIGGKRFYKRSELESLMQPINKKGGAR